MMMSILTYFRPYFFDYHLLLLGLQCVSFLLESRHQRRKTLPFPRFTRPVGFDVRGGEGIWGVNVASEQASRSLMKYLDKETTYLLQLSSSTANALRVISRQARTMASVWRRWPNFFS